MSCDELEIDFKKYVKDFEEQKDCDLLFVCPDGQIGGHSKILNNELEYLKSLESFYSKSVKQDKIKKITLDSPINVVKNLLNVLYDKVAGIEYNRSLEVNKITDSIPYIELASYLISVKILNDMAKAYSNIIIKHLKDKEYRGITILHVWYKAIKNPGLIEGYLEKLIKSGIDNNLECRNWVLSESKTFRDIKVVNSIVSSNYHLSKLVKDTHGLRMLLQIVNDDFKNVKWMQTLSSSIHFLPIEFWLNVCENQEGSLEYIADLHQYKFNNSINIYYRKKIKAPLPNKIKITPFERNLLTKDNFLNQDDEDAYELDMDDSKIVFELSSSKDYMKNKPLKLDLNSMTVAPTEVKVVDDAESDEDVEMIFDKNVNYSIVNVGNKDYLKIVLKLDNEEKEFMVECACDYGAFDNDNSILKFIREIGHGDKKLQYYGQLDPRSTDTVNYAEGRYNGRRFKNIDKNTVIKFRSLYSYNRTANDFIKVCRINIFNDTIEVLFIAKWLILENNVSYDYENQWAGKFLIKLIIPIDDFQTNFDCSKAHNITKYIDVIGESDWTSSIKYGLNDQIISKNILTRLNSKNKSSKYNIYIPEYEDSIGIYRKAFGSQSKFINYAIEGIDSVLMDTGHIVTLVKSKFIVFRIIGPGVESNISENLVKNHNVVNVISKIKTNYLLGHTGLLLKHIGPYVVLLQTFNNSPVDTGINVYCFNVFEMCVTDPDLNKIQVYTIKTDGYYDIIKTCVKV
uniref:Uncharacterized protein n=1 Tax=viral metagenome TaxID=1070528 RepID=A0A6C0EAF3_9ZZZZ